MSYTQLEFDMWLLKTRLAFGLPVPTDLHTRLLGEGIDVQGLINKHTKNITEEHNLMEDS